MPARFPTVSIDTFVVMPNRVHVIICMWILRVGAGLKPAPTGTRPTRHALPEIVRGFKTFSARRINESRGTIGARFWQRNYYERVIRNGEELNRVRQYIIDNPAHWEEDRENPNNVGAVREPPPPD